MALLTCSILNSLTSIYLLAPLLSALQIWTRLQKMQGKPNFSSQWEYPISGPKTRHHNINTSYVSGMQANANWQIEQCKHLSLLNGLMLENIAVKFHHNYYMHCHQLHRYDQPIFTLVFFGWIAMFSYTSLIGEFCSQCWKICRRWSQSTIFWVKQSAETMHEIWASFQVLKLNLVYSIKMNVHDKMKTYGIRDDLQDKAYLACPFKLLSSPLFAFRLPSRTFKLLPKTGMGLAGVKHLYLCILWEYVYSRGSARLEQKMVD